MNLILDTDIGSDCDDAMALAMLNIMHKRGEVNLLSVTHTTSVEWGGACIEAINKFYGNTQIPIGVLKDNNFMDAACNNIYAQALAEKYCPHRLRSDYPDARKVIAHSLRKSERGVTIICIGQLRNIANFFKYRENGESGVELIAEKAEKIVVMGGNFSENLPEYNIQCDVSSAQYVLKQSPVPLYFLDYAFGSKIFTGPQKEKADPVYYTYRRFGVEKRESWDPLTVLYGCGRYSDLFDDSRLGRVVIDDTGVSSFLEEEGKHCILRPAVPMPEYEEIIENIVNREVV